MLEAASGFVCENVNAVGPASSYGGQYHVMPFDVDERLSYLRSDSSDDLTEMWKLYDLYGPTGITLALIVKQ